MRKKKPPHPVDVYVGQRVRSRRILCGMTQSILAEHIGLTFQQLQKYESGANRISASRLWEIAAILDVPVASFFEGLELESPAAVDLPHAQPAPTIEMLEMAKTVQELPRTVQKEVQGLIRILAESMGE